MTGKNDQKVTMQEAADFSLADVFSALKKNPIPFSELIAKKEFVSNLSEVYENSGDGEYAIFEHCLQRGDNIDD